MSATALKLRLRAELKAAMRAKAADEVRLLRTLIAALDNAEAVQVKQTGYQSRKFGDPSGEVARRELDGDAIDGVLAAEAASRLSAAADYEKHGRMENAARLRDEAALVASYATKDLQI